MLTNTFSHIPGIGLITEKRLWESGIRSWDDFVEPYPIRLSSEKIALIKNHIDLSQKHLAYQPEYFAGLLAPDQHWRLFPHFRHSTAFLDIETTGLDKWGDSITTIALYDGRSIFHYVQGDNLEAFKENIQNYQVIVTYNGKCFDVPFIESYLGIRIDQVHIDLRYILKRLGYSGGLKGCERQLGLHRGELDGVDGYFAVLLWDEFKKTNSRNALETLLAYNIMDTVNLESLMVIAYNLHLQKTPFSQSHCLPVPEAPDIPFRADPRIINKIKGEWGPPVSFP